MNTVDFENLNGRRQPAAEISVQVQDANRCLQGARAKLDEAAGLLAVVEYVLRADVTDEETADALKDVFEQVESCTGNAAKRAQEISRQLPSDRDLRQTLRRR
jgi:hypothetical protein